MMEYRSSPDQLEQRLGARVRDLRLARELSQQDLADRANVDRSTVARLERGAGATIATLVRVLRVLDRGDWIDSLAPPEPEVSPLRLLAERRRNATPRRVRRASPPPPAS
jgi:transcriptional regulator with XRE-family HTH domain